jgi:acyl carrier protein
VTVGESTLTTTEYAVSAKATFLLQPPVLSWMISGSMEVFLRTAGAKNILERLQSSPKDLRRALLIDFIEQQLLEILRWDESRRGDLARGFVAIGLDSLMAVELQFRLQKALRFAAPPQGDEAEFQMSSAEDLADFLLSRRLNAS